MAFFKCKMCGGELEITEKRSIVTCEYCGTKQTLPRLDDDRRANMYDRASHFRRNNEFDKAMGVYEQILAEDTTDAEAYWSLVLCRYGIEYVEDPTSGRHIPTVNRAQFTSVYDDENYQAALKYSDEEQRAIYEDEADAINGIQKGILDISGKEEPFDVFICYKETDNRGNRTIDSTIAEDIYGQLTAKGLKVFFARITLEDKLGSAYEPYIFAALNSAKVMLVVGTRPEYFDAVWVKNEWSRYLALVGKSGGEKLLIPLYKDMDPYRLPKEFAHLQAQDMNKIGFMQDLIRGLRKVIGDLPAEKITAPATPTRDTASVEPTLKRMREFLSYGEWDKADDYAERALDIDNKCTEASLGKLLAELHLKDRTMLGQLTESFEGRLSYKKTVRYASEELKAELDGYLAAIKVNKEKTLEAERIAKEKEIAEKELKKKELKKTILKETLLFIGFFAAVCIVLVGILFMTDFEVSPVLIISLIPISIIGYIAVGLLKKKSKKTRKIVGIVFFILVLLFVISFFTLFPAISYANGNYSVYIRMYGVTEFDIPEGVTEIKEGAFRACEKLTKVTIPDSVTYIGKSAFAQCYALKEVNIPDSVITIDNGAFSHCYALEYMKIGSSVESIGGDAFYACIGLRTVEIPDSVTYIGSCAFINCKSLTEVYIPESVEFVGSYAFRDAYYDIFCEAKSEPEEWSSDWDFECHSEIHWGCKK